jgi:hypothetical protein
MIMKSKHTLLAALCGFFAVGPALATDMAVSAINPEADQLLRAACARLAAAKAFTCKAEVWEDAVVLGHKVTTTKTMVAQVRRPDRVQLEIRSPKHSRGFWYDGQFLTLLDRVHNLFGSVAVPNTIDKLLDAASDKFGIILPLEDLLVNDPYASAMEGIKGGAYFGKVNVLGTPCQHIAFSTDTVDWQLWIQDGPNPLPRKLVITYKQEDTAPQVTALFSDWKLKRGIPDKTFEFTPAKGAARIEILPAADTE